ncbi:MAG: ribonuclease P protein subunit [Nitrososphaerota archaeon]|nr:ribonuclease P protein subunit [Nitrososphaerota archaeon]
MSLVGEKIRVMKAADPTFAGRRGTVELETANTLLIGSEGKRVTLAKAGSVVVLEGSGKVLSGEEMAGRLEDRLRGQKR